MTRLQLSSLSNRTRRLLAGLLAASGACYAAVSGWAYLQVTTPNSLQPDFRSLDAVFFGPGKRSGTIERLLESADGPMNRAGTMRPAFTDQSIGWESLTEHATADQMSQLIAEREGERMALLAWIRSGCDRVSFEADDFRWDGGETLPAITAAYLRPDAAPENERIQRVRIRSLVTDRCVTCHGETGRNELARWIPLDSYENIERHCQPEADTCRGAVWVLAALAGLLPLGLISGAAFYGTETTPIASFVLTVLPWVALGVAGGAWLLGSPGSNAIYVLAGAASVAAIGMLIQITASVADLLGHKEHP